MERGDFIRTEEFCANYQVEFAFISALHSSGLIEITTIEENGYISQSQLPELEKLTRLLSRSRAERCVSCGANGAAAQTKPVSASCGRARHCQPLSRLQTRGRGSAQRRVQKKSAKGY